MQAKTFEIIKITKTSADDFYRVLRAPDSEKYSTFYIKKRTGGNRLIEAPIDDTLKRIQKNLLDNLFAPNYKKYTPKSVHSYIENKSIITNAKVHFDKHPKYILKVDLCDFFNSITYERLYGLFRKIWFYNRLLLTHEESSFIHTLCMLVTCNKHLPQGASTSPILSNMICKRMDESLLTYCKMYDVTYTRYADDMTFSFKDIDSASKFINVEKLFSKETEINHNIINIIIDNGFRINTKKVKFISKHKSQKVTGIIINEKINVRRKYINDLRKEIYLCEKGINDVDKKIIGKINFLRQVRGIDDKLANNYAIKINRLTTPPFPDSNFRIDLNRALDYYLVKIETINQEMGTGFFANGFLITSKHVLEIKPYSDISRLDCELGFWPTIRLYYYNSNNLEELLEKEVSIKKCYIYNEIAFVEIDEIEIFNNKMLKLLKNFNDLKRNDNIIVSGCHDGREKSLIISKNQTSIIDIGYYHSSNCLMCKSGTIIKGMSGGPVFEEKTYKVIGVNYCGAEEQDINKGQPNNLASIITRGSYKKAKLWECDEIGKEFALKIIEYYKNGGI